MPRIQQFPISGAILLTLRAAGLRVLAGALILLLSGPVSVRAADVATERLIVSCSSGASDERTIAECVTLQLEQAEASLVRIEESWQRLLQVQADSVNIDTTALAASESATTASVSGSGSAGDDAAGSASTDDTPVNSNVIAIVNDTALQSGIATGGSRVINIDIDGNAVESDRGDAGAGIDSNVDETARFGFLPALFRTYRDQQCAWQAAQFGADRVLLHYQACIASLTERRAQELVHLLAQQRTSDKNGRSFSGYYLKAGDGALFQSCDRRTDWWVTGTDAVLSAIDRRYDNIDAQTVQATGLLYIELNGNVTSAPGTGAGADYIAAIDVRSIGLLRPVSAQDCRAGSNTVQAAISGGGEGLQATGIYQSDAATVDNFASSGFLYGYFNSWQAACAITENSVCSAETSAEFASDGDWRLRVDRSLEGDWRVFLIPVTDDQVIEKQLTMKINDAEVFLDKTYPLSMRLPVNVGQALADGELARELIAKFRQGRELRLQWFDESDVMSELTFSLQGVTAALEYFDNKQ